MPLSSIVNARFWHSSCLFSNRLTSLWFLHALACYQHQGWSSCSRRRLPQGAQEKESSQQLPWLRGIWEQTVPLWGGRQLTKASRNDLVLLPWLQEVAISPSGIAPAWFRDGIKRILLLWLDWLESKCTFAKEAGGDLRAGPVHWLCLWHAVTQAGHL